jgi:hypothetical protein
MAFSTLILENVTVRLLPDPHLILEFISRFGGCHQVTARDGGRCIVAGTRWNRVGRMLYTDLNEFREFPGPFRIEGYTRFRNR